MTNKHKEQTSPAKAAGNAGASTNNKPDPRVMDPYQPAQTGKQDPRVEDPYENASTGKQDPRVEDPYEKPGHPDEPDADEPDGNEPSAVPDPAPRH